MNQKKKTKKRMSRLSLVFFFVLLFALVFASRIHAVGRRSFSSGPSRRYRGFLPSYGAIGPGEIEPEKRKIPTGSNPLHNKR
ncbi:hypothetical protein CARUB_v10025601mg [Capsella rubella]|uniref:Uncharacterized protein n=1 Tax=Capsella rubella TaxID=81985 RepID=R0HV79_9BRAS|nr:hypothetical protein CARUB_v10025601mg [Capsella rubella]